MQRLEDLLVLKNVVTYESAYKLLAQVKVVMLDIFCIRIPIVDAWPVERKAFPVFIERGKLYLSYISPNKNLFCQNCWT